MQGKIIKGIAGFYYVHVGGNKIYECKAKGIFRKDNQKPLVGDNVEITVLDQEEKTGNLIQILPRKNELIRLAVANIDQALVIFAITKPKPNLNLLDRFLIAMERREWIRSFALTSRTFRRKGRGGPSGTSIRAAAGKCYLPARISSRASGKSGNDA